MLKIKDEYILDYDDLMNPKMQTNPKYTEIIKLHDMLTDAGIGHSFIKFHDGYRIGYPKTEDRWEEVMDAIQHWGSYGEEENLIEIMGLLTVEELGADAVLGDLSADEVFERIKNYHNGGRKYKAKER